MTDQIPDLYDFTHRHRQADSLMADMEHGDLYEALRLLGTAIAYAARYGEALPVADLVGRIKTAGVDPAADTIVSEGMARLLEVLRHAQRRGERQKLTDCGR